MLYLVVFLLIILLIDTDSVDPNGESRRHRRILQTPRPDLLFSLADSTPIELRGHPDGFGGDVRSIYFVQSLVQICSYLQGSPIAQNSFSCVRCTPVIGEGVIARCLALWVISKLKTQRTVARVESNPKQSDLSLDRQQQILKEFCH
jgi:hypothetical protein